MKRLVRAAGGGPIASGVAATVRRLPLPRPAITVLTYHRVAPRDAADPLFDGMVSADPQSFERQLDVVERHGRVISIAEFLDVATGRVPARGHSILLTFDDGYRDVAEHAWPILRRRELPATLFVPSAFPDTAKAFWWDRLSHAVMTTERQEVTIAMRSSPLQSTAERREAVRALRLRVKELSHRAAMDEVDRIVAALGAEEPPPAVLSWRELAELQADGMAIASHTRSHPLLTQVSAAEARAEIEGGARDVAEHLGATVPAFAYPSGAHDADIAALVGAAGIAVAFTTRRGSVLPGRADWLRLPRVNVGAATSPQLLDAELALLPRIGMTGKV